MSETFPDSIVGYFYPEDRVNKIDSHLKIWGGGEETLQPDTQYQVLVIDKDQEFFQKRILESSINLSSVISQEVLTNTLTLNSEKLTKNNINLDLKFMLQDLGRFTGYLMNSDTWETQELKEYDRVELKKRLEKVLLHLK